MLIELLVRNLGVIPDLALTFGEGMTAVTGETGAGKTLVVEAIDLLLGGRAEASLVAAGALEARVDGRFVRGKGDAAVEVVLTRVIPRDGRSRAYINGHPVPVTQLVEEGSRFVDLHGQHGHQSLLRELRHEMLARILFQLGRRGCLDELVEFRGELGERVER